MKNNYAWNIFSLQLSNDMEIAAIHLVDRLKHETIDDAAIITSASQERKECNDLQLEVIGSILLYTCEIY